MRRNRNISKSDETGNLPVNHRVGGDIHRLSQDDRKLLLNTAIQILETIGLAEVSPEISNALCEAGAKMSSERVTIPKKLILETIDAMPKTVLLAGQEDEFDMHVGGANVYLGTGGAAPMVHDLSTADYREAVLRDLYDAARIAHECRHINFFARSVVARDVDDPLNLDRATAAASLMGCAKHVMVQASDAAHVSNIAQLCYTIAGSEDAFRARPFLSLNINHAVPPLRLHNESMLVMQEAVKFGIPVHCNVFGQVGASSPVTLAGAAAQTLGRNLGRFGVGAHDRARRPPRCRPPPHDHRSTLGWFGWRIGRTGTGQRDGIAGSAAFGCSLFHNRRRNRQPTCRSSSRV